MSRRSTGFTLAEIVVAGALATAVLGVIVYLFVNFNRQAERPLASLSMEQSTLGILRWLQRDLSETNLQSILTLPNQSGVALGSPRDTSNDYLQISDFGTVKWQKYLYYRVLPVTGYDKPLPPGVQVGALHYDESTTGVTVEPTQPSGSASMIPSRHKVLGQNFLINGTTALGLYVYWTDDAGSDHDFTPTSKGEPVCVALSLLEVSSRTGKPTTRKLFMQVTPKN